MSEKEPGCAYCYQYDEVQELKSRLAASEAALKECREELDWEQSKDKVVDEARRSIGNHKSVCSCVLCNAINALDAKESDAENWKSSALKSANKVNALAQENASLRAKLSAMEALVARKDEVLLDALSRLNYIEEHSCLNPDRCGYESGRTRKKILDVIALTPAPLPCPECERKEAK